MSHDLGVLEMAVLLGVHRVSVLPVVGLVRGFCPYPFPPGVDRSLPVPAIPLLGFSLGYAAGRTSGG
eukprot:12599475-Heterocapsa_arctica.AAC.1